MENFNGKTEEFRELSFSDTEEFSFSAMGNKLFINLSLNAVSAGSCIPLKDGSMEFLGLYRVCANLLRPDGCQFCCS